MAKASQFVSFEDGRWLRWRRDGLGPITKMAATTRQEAEAELSRQGWPVIVDHGPTAFAAFAPGEPVDRREISPCGP